MIPLKLTQAATGFGSTMQQHGDAEKAGRFYRSAELQRSKVMELYNKTPVVTTLFDAQIAGKKGALTPN